MSCRQIQFRLAIDKEQYEYYYRGVAREVIATAIDGRTVQFPITALQPYLLHNGVHGLFQLSYGENNKLISIEKLSD